METDSDIAEKSPDTSGFIPNRIVHIDLKGAPPKMSYLLKMIPLFRQWGANGLLVEYEDMFPYEGDLAKVSKENCYSADDIRSLQDLAKTEGMKFIPLLQSFGHVEFILKKSEFTHLREASMNPMSLCPSHKDTLLLVEEIVDQFVKMHGDLEYLHIGGDEVFCISVCQDCVDSMQTPNQLYLSHMSPLVKLIKSKYPLIKLFVWDDMFRTFSLSELEQLGDVIPMVWSYVDDLSGQFPDTMWQKFSDVFDEVWIASSFKGSSGPICDIPPLQHHINNHLSWLYLIDQLDDKIRKKVKGIAFTGWSRYDHFATLCELLPVSFPCLAICMQVFKTKSFTKDLHLNVSKQLGYIQPLPLNFAGSYDAKYGNFPGSELNAYIYQLEVAKRQLYSLEERVEGWVDAWHIEDLQEVNRGHLEYIGNVVDHLVQTYESIKTPLQECLQCNFFEDTVQEFVKVKVRAKLKTCLEVRARVNNAKMLGDHSPSSADTSVILEEDDD